MKDTYGEMHTSHAYHMWTCTVTTLLLISSVLLMDELYAANMYIATVRDGDPSHLLAVGGSPWPVINCGRAPSCTNQYQCIAEPARYAQHKLKA